MSSTEILITNAWNNQFFKSAAFVRNHRNGCIETVVALICSPWLDFYCMNANVSTTATALVACSLVCFPWIYFSLIYEYVENMLLSCDGRLLFNHVDTLNIANRKPNAARQFVQIMWSFDRSERFSCASMRQSNLFKYFDWFVFFVQCGSVEPLECSFHSILCDWISVKVKGRHFHTLHISWWIYSIGSKANPVSRSS